MLSAALEPYFKAHIPDIMVVPVSVSYDRVLEEKLYAYELLGVPKPKESASVSTFLSNISVISPIESGCKMLQSFFGCWGQLQQFKVSKEKCQSYCIAPMSDKYKSRSYVGVA